MTTTPNTTASGAADTASSEASESLIEQLEDALVEWSGYVTADDAPRTLREHASPHIKILRAELGRLHALAASAPVAPTMVDMVPPATSRDRWMFEQGRLAERDPRTPETQAAWVEEGCALIKAADDAAAAWDYMLDSNDCISVLRGTWKNPIANGCPVKPGTEAAPVAPAPQPAVPTIMRWNPLAGLGMNPAANGLYVRYEDHAAALAAAPKVDHIADASKMVPAPLQQGEYPGLPQGDVNTGVAEMIAKLRKDLIEELAAQPAPVAEDADPLQGAANWLVTSHATTSATELGGRLCIGYNRAERLFNAARAQAVQPEGGAKHD